MSPQRRQSWRDLVVFLAGLGGFGYEVVVSHADRPTLLFLLACMMGLPAFLPNRPRKKSSSGKPGTQDKGEPRGIIEIIAELLAALKGKMQVSEPQPIRMF